MRNRYLAMALVVAGCAENASPGSRYESLAQIVGASIATPDGGGDLGAISDSVAIARGHVPAGFVLDRVGVAHGTHFGVPYRYWIGCSDPMFAGLPCDNAIAVAEWGGTLTMGGFTGDFARRGTWRMSNVFSDSPMVSGTLTLREQTADMVDGPIYTLEGGGDLLMFVFADGYDMMAGGVEATYAVTGPDGAFDLAVSVSLAGPRVASFVLDDTYTYDVDLATGEITAR
jgi:hypothetical protein